MSRPKIESIIYQTTREINSVEDKLRIATVFLFCDFIGSKLLSELLYAENHEKFVERLNVNYSQYEVDFTINFSNLNVKSAFYKTLNKVIEKWDENGFLKAISEKDEFALAILKIVNYDLSLHVPEFADEKTKLYKQLTFNF